MPDEKKCEKCGNDCIRDSVDVDVGVIDGPWGCPNCAWSESEEYDLSNGRNLVQENGWIIDQYGGMHPPTVTRFTTSTPNQTGDL